MALSPNTSLTAGIPTLRQRTRHPPGKQLLACRRLMLKEFQQQPPRPQALVPPTTSASGHHEPGCRLKHSGPAGNRSEGQAAKCDHQLRSASVILQG